MSEKKNLVIREISLWIFMEKSHPTLNLQIF